MLNIISSCNFGSSRLRGKIGSPIFAHAHNGWPRSHEGAKFHEGFSSCFIFILGHFQIISISSMMPGNLFFTQAQKPRRVIVEDVSLLFRVQKWSLLDDFNCPFDDPRPYHLV